MLSGCFDCHIHIGLSGERMPAGRAFDPASVRSRLKAYSEAGVSFLRDGGDNIGASLYAASIAEEYGIDFRTPAFAIHKKGCYGSFIGYSFSDEAELRALIAKAKNLGCDFIKIMATGILDFSRYGKFDEALTRKEIYAAVEMAHGEGFAVMAHANGDEAVYSLVQAGADSIEHGFYASKGAIEAIAGSGAVWCPTLSPIASALNSPPSGNNALQRIYSSQAQAAAYGAALGAVIAVGSDAGSLGVPHAIGTKTEYEYLAIALNGSIETLHKGNNKAKEKFKRFVWK
ncbi:MAG: amidohydrolase family protein [Eubacteriaceae bacterium]|nr:amidohydrolase family protein [Eubacteriaceae bacterium]